MTALRSAGAMTPWILRMIEETFHRDADDRPLRESRTPPEHLRPGDLQHRTCPYPGSRFQHACPMNVAALRQTSAHWRDIVDALALLRARHGAGDGPDVMALWRVSQLGSALPWFHVLRGEVAPGYAAALAKATQGVGIWAQRVLVDELTGAAAPVAAYTAAAVLASAEASGTLVGEREVCAGSEPMLRRFFEALVAGAAPADPSDAIARLAADADDVLRFGAHYANLKLLLWIHALARQLVYADLVHALPAHAGALREWIGADCEPPDFVMLGLPDPAAVPRPARAAWLAGLARRVVAFAPDGSDAPLPRAALAIALASGVDDAPPDLAAEVTATTGCDADAAAHAARALATYLRLDAILGDVAATVEAGLRGCDRAEVTPFDAAARDRLLVRPPRAVLARVAPRALADRPAPRA